MPEGDTLHRTAQTLGRALSGRKVTHFECAYAQPSTVIRDHPVTGETVTQVLAVGKHLLISFSNGFTLRTHLRMNGSWHVYRPQERWQRARQRMRVLIETDTWHAVGFDVPVAELVAGAKLARHEPLRRLGPDYLGPEFPLEQALRNFENARLLPIADALLDQTLASGLGNVFKSELAFLCGVHPFDPVSVMTSEELRHLLELGRELMRANVGDNAPMLRTTTGKPSPGQRLWVYGRIHEPCRKCQTPIVLERRGPEARSTYFCPRCQPSRLADLKSKGPDGKTTLTLGAGLDSSSPKTKRSTQ
jgi:endonuclease-8